jgi:hypothetical protein
MATENSTIAEQEKLLEVLKFTPRTYKIQLWGYGGEYIMGTVDRKIYDYFRYRRLDLSDYAWDSDYADDHDIPEEMQPFPAGSYYDCDDMCHEHGVDRNAGTLQIMDENEEVVYEKRLEDISGMGADGDEPEPEWGGGEEYWIGMKPVGTVVFFGISNEKGTFFEGNIELKQPFDVSKLTLSYDEIDGNDIINRVEYDGEQIENWGADTSGKSSEFGFYLVKDSNTWEKYSTMDDITYTMTDWFPKKVKPVREGIYMIRVPGKSGYTHQARWTGSRWISSWADVETYNTADEVKIKEWQGIAYDPDELEIREGLDKLVVEFDELSKEENTMSTWVLTTAEKKNVVEIEFWTKDGQTIKRSTGFRWGKVYCESEERPDIDLENPDGLEVYSTDYDFQLDSLDDGCWADVEYPADMSQEEQDRMDALWDEESYDGWESEGWSQDECETWFNGPLSLEQE